MKNKLLILLLFTITFLNMIDVVTDVDLGVPLWHILEESAIVLMSGLMGIFLIWENHRKRKDLLKVKQQLSESKLALANITDEMQKARQQYGETIHRQFIQWQLTKGEQEIALLLLKGLSFKEIGEVRDTKEKTIRQQASTIYQKAGVGGRHDLAAWFFEDFLSQ